MAHATREISVAMFVMDVILLEMSVTRHAFCRNMLEISHDLFVIRRNLFVMLRNLLAMLHKMCAMSSPSDVMTHPI
jgi:hypothetical protein